MKDEEVKEKSLSDIIEYYKQQLEDEHNNYLLALADTDNIRKNCNKKITEYNKFRYESIMKDFLPVLDDIERAAKNDILTDGIKLIFTKMLNILSYNGLENSGVEIGDVFDSETMEAVSTLPSIKEEDKNTVADITQKGYVYNGKIIRYPKVIVYL